MSSPMRSAGPPIGPAQHHRGYHFSRSDLYCGSRMLVQPRSLILDSRLCILSVKGADAMPGYRLGLDGTLFNVFEDAEWESV